MPLRVGVVQTGVVRTVFEGYAIRFAALRSEAAANNTQKHIVGTQFRSAQRRPIVIGRTQFARERMRVGRILVLT